jgi:hypothetical protein
VEERILIKFCFNLDHSASKSYAMIENAFHDENVSITQASEWYSCFKSGQISTQGFKCSGRPSSSCTDDRVEKEHQVRWCMTNYVFNILGLSYTTCQHILTKT